MSRKLGTLLAPVAGATLFVAGGLAAVSAPDPAQMALRAGDVPNAQARGKRLEPRAGYTAAYDREFDLRKPYGPSQLVYIDSEVSLAATTQRSQADLRNLKALLRSKSGRELFASAFAQGGGNGITRKDVTLGKLRTPPVGDEAVMLSATIRTKAGRVYAAFTWFRVDRSFSSLGVVGLRAIATADVAKLGALVVAHVGEQFVPVSTAPPTIAGTAAQGQILSASPGTFSTQATVTYTWQRCDAAGAACVDVAGATEETYAVTPEDAGTTIRVVVTATNRFGAVSSPSTPTAVVV